MNTSQTKTLTREKKVNGKKKVSFFPRFQEMDRVVVGHDNWQ